MDIPQGPDPSKVWSMLQEIKTRAKEEVAKADDIPVSILLWGPTPTATCPVSLLRLKLREELRKKGHLAEFSEDLVERDSNYSVKVQQLMHAQHFDLIVSMPVTHGAIGEIHDFIGDNRLNKKMLIFLDETYDYGYSFKSLMATASLRTYKAVPYKGSDELYKIEEEVYETVRIIREIKYLNLGRWI